MAVTTSISINITTNIYRCHSFFVKLLFAQHQQCLLTMNKVSHKYSYASDNTRGHSKNTSRLKGRVGQIGRDSVTGVRREFCNM